MDYMMKLDGQEKTNGCSCKLHTESRLKSELSDHHSMFHLGPVFVLNLEIMGIVYCKTLLKSNLSLIYASGMKAVCIYQLFLLENPRMHCHILSPDIRWSNDVFSFIHHWAFLRGSLFAVNYVCRCYYLAEPSSMLPWCWTENENLIPRSESSSDPVCTYFIKIFIRTALRFNYET